MSLAGGFCKGDRVLVAGHGTGTVHGPPARAAAAKVSLGVYLDSENLGLVDVRASDVCHVNSKAANLDQSQEVNSKAADLGQSQEVADLLSRLESDLKSVENSACSIQQDAAHGKLDAGTAHSELAQLESRAKSLESRVDEILLGELVDGKERLKMQKRSLLQGLSQLFSMMDDLFKQLSLAKSQGGKASRPAPAKRDPSSRAMGPESPMELLAGGFEKGDRVIFAGSHTDVGTVLGPPAKRASSKLSVTVRFDTGDLRDVRAAELQMMSQTSL